MQIIDIRNQLPRAFGSNNGPKIRRPLSAIKRVAIHWDAMYRPHEYDSIARYVQEANIHINRDWGGANGDGLMYHYKIDNVGDVYWCRDHEDMLWNVGGSANWDTLAVCFDAGDDQTITKEQAEAFKELMEKICFEHPEFPASQGDVYGHREFNATKCPGDQIMNLCVIPYRQSRTVSTTGLVYDWPEETAPTPVVATTPQPEPQPAPVVEVHETEPEVVVESPENQHTSQQEIDAQESTETPEIEFEVTPVPETTNEEKANTATPSGSDEVNMDIKKTNGLLQAFVDFMNGKKTWSGLAMILLGSTQLPTWLCGTLEQSACATEVVNTISLVLVIGGFALAAYGNWKNHKK